MVTRLETFRPATEEPGWPSKPIRAYVNRGFDVLFLHARESITPFQQKLSYKDPDFDRKVTEFQVLQKKVREKLIFLSFDDVFEYLYKLMWSQKQNRRDGV
jgi:hypothetical protein